MPTRQFRLRETDGKYPVLNAGEVRLRPDSDGPDVVTADLEIRMPDSSESITLPVIIAQRRLGPDGKYTFHGCTRPRTGLGDVQSFDGEVSPEGGTASIWLTALGSIRPQG